MKSKMIGVDAGALGITDPKLQVGVWRVVSNILLQIARLDRDNAYILYSFDPIPSYLLNSFGSRMQNKVLRPKKGWMSLRLPLELRLHPCDVFIGFGQSLPLFSGKKIGFVYDLGFVHALHLYPDSARRLMGQTQNLISRADHIVTISDSVKTDIIRTFGVVRHKISTMTLGVDAHFGPKGEAYKSERPYFLFVGSLKPGKNIPMLVRAFARFNEQSKKRYDLFLIGSTYWLDPDIENVIRTFHLEQRIRIIGFVADAALAAYYRGAAAFVSPSLVEGFCLPAAEAMASGVPVLVSDIPVMHEIVGESGFFVDPASASSIAQGLKATVTDTVKIQRYKESARTRAGLFTWQKSAEKVLNSIRHMS
jgi:glycosyltransferase involved in cell wall biosynthesis